MIKTYNFARLRKPAELVTKESRLFKFLAYAYDNGIYSETTWVADIISRCARTFRSYGEYWAYLDDINYYETRQIGRRFNKWRKSN